VKRYIIDGILHIRFDAATETLPAKGVTVQAHDHLRGGEYPIVVEEGSEAFDTGSGDVQILGKNGWGEL